MSHIYSQLETHPGQMDGEVYQIVTSPWNPRHFAVLNLTTNTFTNYSDISDYADAERKLRCVVERAAAAYDRNN